MISNMKLWKAEIIAVGDEMTLGQRLDTNSQWLSIQLCDLGIEPTFHTTVGDDLEDGINVVTTAMHRADLVIITGGIGPTQDDLTRQVLARVANVELEFHPEVAEHIQSIFTRTNRPMPENNLIQAWFPAGSRIIANREGTAPGIEMDCQTELRRSRIFALPGVPYEMQQMWVDYVFPAIGAMIGKPQIIKHHVVRCFGAGESQIETMLAGLTERGRQPRVGITASQATISLRITAVGDDESDCQTQLGPTLALINQRLGDLVFGENEVALQDIVVDHLARHGLTFAMIDYGFGGAASHALSLAKLGPQVHAGTIVLPARKLNAWLGGDQDTDIVTAAARKIRADFDADIGIAVSEPESATNGDSEGFEIAIVDHGTAVAYSLSHGGHTGLRHSRTTKQILNQIRLHLKR